MRRTAAAVPAGFGPRLGGRMLSARERVLVGLAVVVVIPSVVLGRHLFELPSLIERGIALLAPGAEAHGAEQTPRAAAGELVVPLARLADPLVAGVRPAHAPRSAPARHRRVVRAGGARLSVARRVAPAASRPPATAVPTGDGAPATPSTDGTGTGGAAAPPVGGAGSRASAAAAGGGGGGGANSGGTSGVGSVTTPSPTASVGVHDGSIGVSAGSGGGPVPVTASAGASTAGVSAGVSAGDGSADAGVPLPTTDPGQVTTPTATVAPVTTPVLMTSPVTVPTATVSLPPVLP